MLYHQYHNNTNNNTFKCNISPSNCFECHSDTIKLEFEYECIDIVKCCLIFDLFCKIGILLCPLCPLRAVDGDRIINLTYY